jgi:hypothetical protein
VLRDPAITAGIGQFGAIQSVAPSFGSLPQSPEAGLSQFGTYCKIRPRHPWTRSAQQRGARRGADTRPGHFSFKSNNYARTPFDRRPVASVAWCSSRAPSPYDVQIADCPNFPFQSKHYAVEPESMPVAGVARFSRRPSPCELQARPVRPRGSFRYRLPNLRYRYRLLDQSPN